MKGFFLHNILKCSRFRVNEITGFRRCHRFDIFVSFRPPPIFYIFTVRFHFARILLHGLSKSITLDELEWMNETIGFQALLAKTIFFFSYFQGDFGYYFFITGKFHLLPFLPDGFLNDYFCKHWRCFCKYYLLGHLSEFSFFYQCGKVFRVKRLKK